MNLMTVTFRWALIAVMALGAPLWCCCVGSGEMAEPTAMVEESVEVMSCHGGMDMAMTVAGVAGEESDQDEPCDCGHEMQMGADLLLELGVGDGFVLPVVAGMDWFEVERYFVAADFAGPIATDRGPPGGRSVRILLGRLRV